VLLSIVAGYAACSPQRSADPPASQPTAAKSCSQLVRLPLGWDGVVLEQPPSVPLEDIELERAEALAERRDERAGDERWLLRAFDGCSLYFVLARLVENPQRGVRPWARLVIERRFRVERTPRAELRLGVRDQLIAYEQPVQNVRAGMSQGEVRARLGAPSRVEQLGPVGSFDWVYANRRIRFLEWKVAHVDTAPASP
jgi:hypothetical protein